MHYARLVQLLDALAPCPDESHVAIFTPEVRLETAMHTHSERALGGRWLVMILDVPLLEFGRAPRVAAEPAAAQIGGRGFFHTASTRAGGGAPRPGERAAQILSLFREGVFGAKTWRDLARKPPWLGAQRRVFGAQEHIRGAKDAASCIDVVSIWRVLARKSLFLARNYGQLNSPVEGAPT